MERGAAKLAFFSPLKWTLPVLLLLLLALAQPLFAQEGTSRRENKGAKTKTEKGWRGDRATKSDRRQKMVNSKMRTKQGDRPHKGSITGRKITTKTTTGRPTPSKKAEPNPYAGTRRRTEATAAKQAARRYSGPPVTATRPPERAHKGSISGGRIRTENASSARSKSPAPRVDPYRYVKKKTEADVARQAARRTVPTPYTATRKGERSGLGSGGGRLFTYPSRKSSRSPNSTNPYAGRRASAAAGSRSGPKGRRVAMSATRSGESKANGGGVLRSISGIQGRSSTAANPYAGKKSYKEGEKAAANARKASGVRTISPGTGPGQGKRLSARSASGNIFINKQKDPYRFRKSKPWEQAHPGDITGRKPKTKFTTGRPEPRRPSFNPYYGRKGAGERAYSGNVRPKGSTASRPSESRPGSANIRNQSVTGQFKGPGKATFDPYKGRKPGGEKAYSGNVRPRQNSISRSGESKPGSSKNVRSNSISGQFKVPDKSYSPYVNRGKKRGDVGYSGNVRPKNNSVTRSSESRPGSSENVKNNSITAQFKGAGKPGFNPYYGRKKGGDQAYSGNVRPRSNSISRSSEAGAKRDKYIGGDKLSITGANKADGKRLPQQQLSKTGKKSAAFAGNMKARKPLQGGGSVARNNWNNEGLSVTQKVRSNDAERASMFSGNMKARKPMQGGGSLSRNNWNNEGLSVTQKVRTKDAERASAFSGFMKAQKPLTGGGSVSRNNWNNDKMPLKKIPQSPQIYYATRFRGDQKESDLIPQANMSNEGWTGNYKKKWLIADKNDDYVNYSGTIKVVRRKGQGYHPSFYFHREEISSVDEKEKKLSIKMLWGKFFRSNQPSNLRKKPGKLEFDEREQGLWYE